MGRTFPNFSFLPALLKLLELQKTPNTKKQITPAGLNIDNPWQETSERFAAWGQNKIKQKMPLSLKGA
ncbi:MAG: hypothetical protein J1E16_03170 [Muribaculaceae bacterium]|nr:hypothetical protein [Muribaculaceae bacterium]